MDFVHTSMKVNAIVRGYCLGKLGEEALIDATTTA